ncbi:MAG: hypothetical protein P8Y68_14425 [Anaerolineales bacterium]
MNTPKGYFKIITLIGLTLMLALSAASIHASSSKQTKTDFDAIDAYIQEQMDRLGIPGLDGASSALL